MNAHRQFIKPQGRTISFELPTEFDTNNEVEVIVLPLDRVEKVRKKIDLRHLRGSLAHLPEEEKQNSEQYFTNIRNEWERDI